jgi:II/X family phage/plasmid replication protein
MPDTIKIKHFCKVLENYDFQHSWKKLSNFNGETWINNPKNKEPFPRLSIFRTPDNFWHITAEVSLPRLLFGHNARLPNQHETFEGLKIIGEYVEEKSGLPFDPFSAIVSRVDFTLDIQLTEAEVIQIINKLSFQKLGSLEKLFYNGKTLYFQTKSKEKIIRIYGKYQEVLSRKNATPEEKEYAKGKLRIECSLKGKQLKAMIKRLALPDNSVLSVLNEDVSNKIISEILERLNFDEIRTNDYDLLEDLLEKCSTSNAMQNFSFLEMIKRRGLNFYKDESLHYKERTYKRRLAECRKAKVWIHPKSFE